MELFDSMFIEGFLKHFHLISVTLEESDRHKPVQLDAEELDGSCDGQCSLLNYSHCNSSWISLAP